MTSQPSTGFEDQAQHRLQSISTEKGTEKPQARQVCFGPGFTLCRPSSLPLH